MRRENGWLVLAGCLMILSLLLAACGSGSTAPGSGSKSDPAPQGQAAKPAGSGPAKVTIDVLLPDLENEWFVDVKRGMEAYAKEQGFTVNIHDAQKDSGKETAALEAATANKTNAIVISGTDPAAPLPALERAQAAGIKVVQFNLKLKSDTLGPFVGVDNYELGRMAGQAAAKYIQEKLGGSARIAMLGRPESPAGQDRAKGFKDEVTKLPGVKVVAEQRALYREEAVTAMEAIMQANPDLTMVWGYNEGSTMGALQAVKAAGKDQKIAVVGTDLSKDAAAALKEKGALKAIATQQPAKIGRTSLEIAVKLIRGEKVDDRVLVPVTLVTPETVDEYTKN